MIDFRQTSRHVNQLLQQGTPSAEIKLVLAALPRFPNHLSEKWPEFFGPIQPQWSLWATKRVHEAFLRPGEGTESHRPSTPRALQLGSATSLEVVTGEHEVIYYRKIDMAGVEEKRPYRFSCQYGGVITGLIDDIEKVFNGKPSDNIWKRTEKFLLTEVLNRFNERIIGKKPHEVADLEAEMVVILTDFRSSAETEGHFDTIRYWESAAKYRTDVLMAESLQLNGIFEGWRPLIEGVVKRLEHNMKENVEAIIKKGPAKRPSVLPLQTVYTRIGLFISLVCRLIHVEKRLSRYDDEMILKAFLKSVQVPNQALKELCGPTTPSNNRNLSNAIDNQMELIFYKLNRLSQPVIK